MEANMNERIQVTIVVSVYNEEAVLEKFFKELTCVLESESDINYEIIFVNDGSIDKSIEIINCFTNANPHVKVIKFSKNFGHEAAMIAGIDHSSGKVVICMDADLQHPPTMIPMMINKYKEKYDIVNMVRSENQGVGMVKKITSRGFYSFLNLISPFKFEPNASDFFLISDRVAIILRNDFRERARFLRGFIQLIGFRKTSIEFIAPKRSLGKSKYSLAKLFKFSLNAIFTFSYFPLRLGIFSSIIAGGFGLAMIIFAIIKKIQGQAPPGYTTVIVLICVFFSIQFFITGVIGEYIGFIFDENKKRPIYIIDQENDRLPITNRNPYSSVSYVNKVTDFDSSKAIIRR
jgi:glycosyltransferase involved in cell wall biosynthesis